MHDAALVRVLERVAQRQADPQDVAVGQRARCLQRGERAALDELADQVARVVLLAGVVEPDDAGVVEARGGLAPPAGRARARRRRRGSP